MARDSSSSRPSTTETVAKLLLRHMDPSLAEMDYQQLAGLLDAAGDSRSRPEHAIDQTRWQDDLIEKQVPAGSSVLDLGCGGGELLVRLMQRKNVRGQGVELEASAVFECVARGVPVVQCNLDEGLKGFSDHSFDYIVLEETLQTLHRPIELLKEMLRVGRRSIVSFPNFGYWQVRFDLALRGRMPITPRLPSRWYNTENIHLLTLQDFLDWAEENHVRIVEGHALANGSVRRLEAGDNLYAEEALLIVEKTVIT